MYRISLLRTVFPFLLCNFSWTFQAPDEVRPHWSPPKAPGPSLSSVLPQSSVHVCVSTPHAALELTCLHACFFHQSLRNEGTLLPPLKPQPSKRFPARNRSSVYAFKMNDVPSGKRCPLTVMINLTSENFMESESKMNCPL